MVRSRFTLAPISVLVVASPLFSQGSPAPAQPKKPTLTDQEDAIIAVYRKGAKPRQPAPKGRLLPEELNTIRRFKDAKPSVVYVSTLADEVNQYTGDVTRVPAGTGTGWVWDDRGHVVTNFHVVSVEKDGTISNAAEVRVTLANGKTYQARVIGFSLAYDTAVLQVFAPLEDLKPLPVGSSGELEVGQGVIAIGNPWGLDHTLSTGVVSALNRTLPTQFNTNITDVIQTDAAINPGNSGGPLLDTAGRVIGMNAYIPAATGASVGIGFSIPIDTLNRIVPLLISRGPLVRPRMGFDTLVDVQAHQLGVDQGVIVNTVEPGSPAARAGLRGLATDAKQHVSIGDVIIAIDGHRLETYGELVAYLEQADLKNKVEITVVRGDQILKLTLDLRAGAGKI
ncbi:MAG TPA: trypsin-like peptidase domain-containing protein [Holophagaceae bacterium]|jgi:S1-C subfamily serine protease|nr:trypsin-like peptidase domain-containing protein [Holophagaceae bacterium]